MKKKAQKIPSNNGLIRDFDLKQPSVKTLYIILLLIGILISLAGIAPLIWLFLSGFKDLREFVRAVVFAIIPPILLFIIFQKQISGMALHSGIKG